MYSQDNTATRGFVLGKTRSTFHRKTKRTQKYVYATPVPPIESAGYLDRLKYRSVHFYGAALHEPLTQAAAYLQRVEAETGRAPHVLCLHDEFSEEDGGTDLAWRLTLVLGELPRETVRRVAS